MPMSRRWAGRAVTSWPSTRTRPDVGSLEAGQDAQRGGLAATRRPEQSHELARRDVQREAVERLGGAEPAAQVLQCHAAPPESWSVAGPAALVVSRSCRLPPESRRDTANRFTSPPPVRRPAEAARDHHQHDPGDEQGQQRGGHRDVRVVLVEATIQTGNVWYRSRLAMVYSPRTRATVRTVAESIGGPQVGQHDPPQRRPPPAPQRSRRVDQRLQVDGAQAGVERAVGEGHRQHHVDRAPAGRACSSGGPARPAGRPTISTTGRDDDRQDGDEVHHPAQPGQPQVDVDGGRHHQRPG